VSYFGFPYSVVIFSSPIYFFFAVNRDEDVVRESFSVKLFYILQDIRLSSTFCEPYFHVVFCVCSLLFFFSQADVNITLITGHIHRSNVYKIDPTSEYVEMVKNTISITLGYIIL
jgi:hypothetical protein